MALDVGGLRGRLAGTPHRAQSAGPVGLRLEVERGEVARPFFGIGKQRPHRLDHGVAGYDAITPLLLNDGKVVLVNRGFLPLASAFPPAPKGEVSLLGRIRATSERRTGAVSDPATGELSDVQRIDIDRLQQQIDGQLVPVYVQLLKSTPAETPSLSAIVDPEFGNGPHLSYTVQWWFFSLCAAGGWVVLVRRELLKQKKS